MVDLLTETRAEVGATQLSDETTAIAARPDTPLDKLFSDLGGPAAVGRILSVTTEHAATMKRRASIPIEHWPTLIMSPVGVQLKLTEGRLLFAHTNVVVNNGASLLPQAPTAAEEVDEEAKVRWTPRDPSLLFNLQPATRVYRNGFDQVVICQETQEIGDDDPFVFFQQENIPQLIAALQKEARRG